MFVIKKRIKMLTKEELQSYDELGYHLTGKILSDQEIEAMRAEELRMRNHLSDKMDVTGRTSFISNVCRYSEPIRNISSNGSHMPMIKSLIGENIQLWFTQFVLKMPDLQGNKSEFPWHQDNGYGIVAPATNVTMWVALDDATIENGCVWVVPGSHKQGLVPHVRKSPSVFQLITKDDPAGQEIPVELKAGEAVIFSGLTLHRSKQNHTDKPRRAFFMEYADAAAQCKAYNWETDSYDNELPISDRSYAMLVAGQVALDDKMEYT